MRLAELLADRLAAAGVRTAFGFPGGGGNLDLLQALSRAGVRFVLARSEGGAAFMAAAWAEMTGDPALVMTSLGPGVANVVNGVAHARLDRAPILVVSDRYAAEEAATSGHQRLDHLRLLSPVTKWQATLSPATAGETVARALALSRTPPAGPVHLDLPRDAAAAEVNAAAAGPAAAPAAPGPAADEDLATAAARLRDARRPVLLVGLEAAREAEPRDLVALAEALAAPVLVTYKAKGAFPERHRLWAGILAGGRIEAPLVARADLLVAAGVDPVELLPVRWPYAAEVVAFDSGTDRTGHLAAARRLPLEALPRVSRALGAAASEWREGDAAEFRETALAALRVAAPGSLASWEVVEAVLAESPDAVVSVDAGAHMFAATWFWRSQAPRRFLISNGLATMGFAVPAAVAAALRHPGTPVVAFTGDGGFLLHGAELETAVRLGLALVVVVLNDASLSLIRVKQVARGLDRQEVDFGPVRFDLVAEAVGARGFRVASLADLRPAYRQARSSGGCAVLDVRLSGAEYPAMLRVLRG